MPSAAPSSVPSPPRMARLEELFEELAELTGQRNVVDGRIVDIVAEIDHDGLWAVPGVKSVTQLVAWKAGVSPRDAENLVAVAVAERADEFHVHPGFTGGRLSLDQVGVIAERAADGPAPGITVTDDEGEQLNGGIPGPSAHTPRPAVAG